jgi:hypothetical protein
MTILIEAQLRNAIAAMKYALKTIDESNPAYSILQYSITTSDLALEVSEAGLPPDPVVKPAGACSRTPSLPFESPHKYKFPS